MAIYKQGLLGPFKGKVGNIVGSNWRTIDYLRSLPVKSKKATSVKQLTQRLKFSLAIDFLAPFREIIHLLPGGKHTSKKTHFNEAAAILIKNMEGQYPNLIIPFKAVVFTKGSLMNILPMVEIINSEEVKITWSSRLGYGASDNDRIHIIVHNESLESSFHFKEISRNAGEYVLFADEIGKGLLHIWTFVTSADGAEYSNSTYCGALDLK